MCLSKRIGELSDHESGVVRAHSDPYESSAPAAKRPRYRRDGQTDSQLYVNAAWDPRWEDSYIAPRITFEQSFPASVRDVARRVWNTRYEDA